MSLYSGTFLGELGAAERSEQLFNGTPLSQDLKRIQR